MTDPMTDPDRWGEGCWKRKVLVMLPVIVVRLVIVAGLSRACLVVDRWLWWAPGIRRLGCPSGMALWSSQLDERWHTGLWKEPDGTT